VWLALAAGAGLATLPAPASANTHEVRAAVEVVLDAQPDKPQDFRFAALGAGLSRFTLDDDDDPTLSARKRFELMRGELGIKLVALRPVTGWRAPAPTCTGDPDAVTTERVAVLDVDRGEQIECRFVARCDPQVCGFGKPTPVGGIFPETSSDIGPFIDSNGNLYTVTEVSNAEFEPAIRKSADGGRTWTEVDGANRPTVDDLESVSLVQDGARIHMLHQRSGYRVFYNSFNTSDAAADPDRWVVRNEQVFAGGVAIDQSASLVVRGNGDLVAFYVVSPTQIAYRTQPAGGSWGPQAVLDDTPGKAFSQVLAEPSRVDDSIHIAYKNHTDSTILYRTLGPDGLLSAPVTVASGTTRGSSGQKAMPNHGLVVQEAGGRDRVTVAWRRADGMLAGAVIENGVVGDGAAISDAPTYQNPVNVLSNQVVAALAPDDAAGTVHALHADLATHDLWHDVRAPDWGVDEEVLDDADVMAISARVLTHAAANGGRKVLGIVFDQEMGIPDEGAVHYTEIELSGR
jgi:hypothetical protein